MGKKSKKAEPEPKAVRVHLHRLTSNNEVLRTKSVRGMATSLPRPGHQFVLFSESLTPGTAFCMVTTSLVVQVIPGDTDDQMTFSTLNSRYGLEILLDEEEE